MPPEVWCIFAGWLAFTLYVSWKADRDEIEKD